MKEMTMDLVYVGANGTDHLYHILADGDRPVLEIYVDAKPGVEQLPIRINAVGAPLDNAQPTKGFTVMATMFTEDANGTPSGLTTLPNIVGIAQYIVPRIHTMMARVYVPKVNAES